MKSDTIKFFIKLFSFLIVCALVFYCIVTFCKAGVKNEEEDYYDLTKTICREVANTGSMKPAFDENYYIMCRKIPFSQIRVGDVIVFRPAFESEHEYICHRVFRISSRGTLLVTKGDNNPHIDPGFVSEQNYESTVLGIFRKYRVEEPMVMIK